GGHQMQTVSNWQRIEKVLATDYVRSVYIYGPPGTGKTYAALNFGRVRRGVDVITLTEDMSATDLRGHYVMLGGDAVWHDGPFVQAMRAGKRLVINEISNASSDVLQELFFVLESPETARVKLVNGDIVRPRRGFHVVATDNNPPDRLPAALQDRFMAYLRV